MRPARIILLYVVAVVVLGALLAPPVYWLINERWLFRRVFDRTILVVAVLGLWPMFRGLGARSWSALGYARDPAAWRRLLAGFGTGVITLGIGAVALLALGTRQYDPAWNSHSATPWPITLAMPVLIGVVVGVVEETLFRGGVFGALRKGLPAGVALTVTSAIYSAVHFLKPPKGIALETVTWWSGFAQLALVFRYSFQQPGAVIGFVTLFLAGVILALAYQRTGALYYSIGLHAGWVCAIKMFAGLTDNAAPRQWWGGGSLVDNMLVWPVLLVMWWLIYRWPTQSSNG